MGTLTGPSDFGGTGPLNLSGSYHPGSVTFGDTQTASVSFAQNMTFQGTTSITMQIGGLAVETEHDQLVFNGAGTPQVTWAGTLALVLINGFVPQVGNSFNLFDFDSARDAGTFSSITLPVLGAGKFWRLDQLLNSGIVRISVTADTYNAWQTGYLAGTFAADDDKDGIKNGIEFLLGTDPKSPYGAGQFPITEQQPVVGANRTVSVIFKIPADPASDARYRLQGSNDLVMWSTIASKDGGGAWTNLGANIVEGPVTAGYRTITGSEVLALTDTRRFHRLQAATP